ncbi:MAG: ADP-ribosylation factor-like protein [Terriglobales bacterium]
MPDKRPPIAETYKLVYFGAPGAGKRTNLSQLQQRLEAAPVQATDGDGALNLSLNSLQPVAPAPVSIFTLSGVLDTAPAWGALLKGVHGVVFVADSNADRFSENLRAMTELIGRLAYYRLKIDNFPVIVQYNKRDLPNAVPVARLEEELNPFGMPAFSTVASDGTGVLECAQILCHLIGKLRAG